MERNFIKNISRTMLTFNLPKDSDGTTRSMCLSKGEISAAMSNADLASPEVQKALKGKFVTNVTALMARK